jgi:exodeoxyribonuclease VII large subunit
MRLAARLERAARARVRTESTALTGFTARVRLAHPDNILARGYAIVRSADGAPLASARSLAPGEAFTVSMRDGAIDARVANLHLQPQTRSGSEEESRDD